ncbi:MAG: aminotransferase class V-fold PLP-dependent enzyme [Deltaproteobacteria bacterium]|nr:aminotransferase class V-fold PLP-dependent enzyme [Deltaproteobacteria bacterium]
MASNRITPNWLHVARDFQVNQELVWLNSCGIAPMPTPVLSAVKAHLDAYARKVIFGPRSDEELRSAISSHLAARIGALPHEVAPIHHTTEGMTFISLGLNLSAGDGVVLMANEYPSNVYPWQHLQSQGVTFQTLADGPTPEDVIASASQLLDERTRVLAVSAVHWCTGMPLPLQALGRLCKERDVLFVVDGAQGVGHVPIDVNACNIGAMAFSAWKWLMGPIGLGAFYVRQDLLAELKFPFKGTGSVVNDHVYFPYRDDLKPNTARYVVSTPSFTDWAHFEASLSYLDTLGVENVRNRVHALALHLGQQLKQQGFELARDGFATHPTAIVAARAPGRDMARLVADLGTLGIVAAERLGWMRMAPHIHLNEDQLDTVATTAGRLLRAQS